MLHQLVLIQVHSELVTSCSSKLQSGCPHPYNRGKNYTVQNASFLSPAAKDNKHPTPLKSRLQTLELGGDVGHTRPTWRSLGGSFSAQHPLMVSGGHQRHRFRTDSGSWMQFIVLESNLDQVYRMLCD